MVLAFPSNPAIGQVYQQWTWDGQKWVCSCVGISPIPPGGNDMPIQMILFTTNGTYTPSSNMVSCIVECVGGGGGGGGAFQVGAGGGGGGSGGYSRGLFSAAQIGSSQTVTVGAGGAAGTSGNGGNGGTTSLGTLVIANGGTGGLGNSGTGGFYGNAGLGGAVGSVTSSGGLVLAGNPGTHGETATAFQAYGGVGGAIFGGGPEPTVPGTGQSFAGGNGSSGAGGGGGAIGPGATGGTWIAGGVGGIGWCLVTEYS